MKSVCKKATGYLSDSGGFRIWVNVSFDPAIEKYHIDL